MGVITLDDFAQSVAYREIFGRDRQEGRHETWQKGELALALLIFQRRCGQVAPEPEARIRARPPYRLETLLDFDGMADLKAWLVAKG